MGEREHQPADSDGDENERQESPHGVADAFAEFALGQKRERDGNAEREDQHGLEMIQHFVFAHLMNFFGASHLDGRERSRRRKLSRASQVENQARLRRPISYASKMIRKFSTPAAAKMRVP